MSNKWLSLCVSTFFLALPAQAEIFKCKNEKGKISYEQSPCPDTMVGKVAPQRDPSLEDQIDAHNRAERMKEQVRQKEAAEAARRQQVVPAEVREKRRPRPMHCTPDYAGGMYCH